MEIPKVKAKSGLVEFETHCRHWLSVFGLHDWVATFSYGASAGHRAEVSYSHESRQAVFKLSKAKSSGRELRLSALHEVGHLLLADLSGMAEEIKNPSVVVQEEHRIIARLENYITSLNP